MFTVVALSIAINSLAVLPVASAAEIVIVYAFVPVRVLSESTVSASSMPPLTVPVVNASISFAWATVRSPLTNRFSSPRPVTPSEPYRSLIS